MTKDANVAKNINCSGRAYLETGRIVEIQEVLAFRQGQFTDMFMRGAVIVAQEDKILTKIRKFDDSLVYSHSVNYWADVLACDLWSGNKVDANLAVIGELEQYDWLLINQNTLMWPLTILLRKLLPRVKIIALYEGSLDSIGYYSSKEKILYFETLKNIDCLAALVEEAIPFHVLYTDKPIHWLGVPYPLNFVRSLKVDKSKREKIIALGSALNHRNTLTSLLVALRGFPEDFQIMFQSFNDGEEEFINKSLSKTDYDRIILHQPLSWIDFLKKYSSVYACVNLCNRYTWGRINLDMAALGIPTIGTRGCETQQKLFPSLTVSDAFRSIPEALNLCKAILRDSVLQDITHSIDNYNEAEAIIRFNNILTAIF